jgi:YcaO-like protein with predicted kinase domain
LIREETVKVPINFTAYIHGSNGIAAGNTIEEAIVQATCEIFERYATVDIVKNERIIPTIEPDSVADSLIKDMIRYFESKNVQVMIKDLSFGGLLPSIGVLFINNNLLPDRLEHRILIAGASFTSREGLIRCFTEGMQGRQTLEKTRPELDKPVVHKSRVKNLYLLMKCGISVKDISFLDQGEIIPFKHKERGKDLFSELEQIKSLCKQFNTDCIILNCTHPVLDFPVVRVVIPGVSDFLPFLDPNILISEATKPDAEWGGNEFRKMMQSFFTR